ncbi:hypothetical protein DPM33_14960 [Mesorhizobium hawassense]|uniref:Uncharacterized protein n=1 Tax=Mesorhizobium hawassense TaxID=1209954 RepID=A0A330HU57_9HYPH|nr:hypothetical protein DPM33_14960 [Mesorhizobium hawassense]
MSALAPTPSRRCAPIHLSPALRGRGNANRQGHGPRKPGFLAPPNGGERWLGEAETERGQRRRRR